MSMKSISESFSRVKDWGTWLKDTIYDIPDMPDNKAARVALHVIFTLGEAVLPVASLAMTLGGAPVGSLSTGAFFPAHHLGVQHLLGLDVNSNLSPTFNAATARHAWHLLGQSKAWPEVAHNVASTVRQPLQMNLFEMMLVAGAANSLSKSPANVIKRLTPEPRKH